MEFTRAKDSVSEPLPLDLSAALSWHADNRIWLGNISTQVKEIDILKLCRSCGQVQQFDFLIHQQGPEFGKPRGYCFVSYETKEVAAKAIARLDGITLQGRKLRAKWAADKDISMFTGQMANPQPAKSVTTQGPSVESKIKAIEAKLKEMSKTSLELSLSTKEDTSMRTSISAVHGTARKPYTRPIRSHRNHRNSRNK